MSPVRAAALFNRAGVSPLQGSSCRIRPNPGLHPGLWAKGRAFCPRVERLLPCHVLFEVIVERLLPCHLPFGIVVERLLAGDGLIHAFNEEARRADL